jgi:Protein of unknown function (DUF1579)
MDMPTVGPEIKALTALFRGTWRGPEKLHPSPWDPAGGPAFGTWVVYPSLDGFYLLVDYTEERDGKVVYRGHGVHGWESSEGAFLEFWFDNIGVTPRAPNRATLTGTTYSYLSSGPSGASRFTYAFDGDQLRFTIEAQEGESWRMSHEGTYTRV